MNSSRLLETIEELLDAEAATNFQVLLADAASQLSALSSQPSSPAHQTNFAHAFEQLRNSYERLQAGFEPAQIARFQDINAGPFFADNIPGEISKKIAENPATLAVAQQFVADLVNNRQRFLTTLSELRDRLEVLGVISAEIEPGNAEIGFTIPRHLFDDNLDGLLNELREVRFIIRAFSEIVTGSVETIAVKQISTSDPLFFFGISVGTIVAIGKAVHWVLDTWKKVEEIREVRERTRKLKIEGDKSILEMFDLTIKSTIEAQIDAKVKEFTSEIKTKDGRAQELDNHLTRALNSLFARIERGMTVEVRFVSPPTTATGDKDESADRTEASTFSQLADVAPKLVFPPPAVEPILSLPGSQGS